MKKLSFLAVLAFSVAVQARADALIPGPASYSSNISGECTISVNNLCSGITFQPQDTSSSMPIDNRPNGQSFNFAGTDIHYTVGVYGDDVELFAIDNPALNGISLGGFTFGGSAFDFEAIVVYRVAVVQTGFDIFGLSEVPVLVSAQGSVACDSSGPDSVSSGLASFSFTVGGFPIATCGTAGTVEADSFFGSDDFLFPIGIEQPVFLTVSASLGTTYVSPQFTGQSSFFGEVDPIFQIDPSFPFANDFELVYSPNLVLFSPTVPPTVPEPSTWLLLASGLVGIVVAKRRRPTQIETNS